MTVQIEHYRQQLRWEPWKALAVAAGAGAGIMAALVALATALLHYLGAH